MKRTVGTVVRGLRAPIIHEGDDLAHIVVDTVLQASEAEGFPIEDQDVVTITESILARAQGNYISIDAIAQDVRSKVASKKIGVVFPIMSRNRFQSILKAIARAGDEVIIQLSYPADEVGNPLVDLDTLEKAGVNPWEDVLSEEEAYQIFGDLKHPFTGVDYLKLYRETVEGEGASCTLILANQAPAILEYTDHVIAADIHSRKRTKKQLKEAGGKVVLSLDDLATEPIDGSGCNPDYGLLGSNLASDEKVKLFPTGSFEMANRIQDLLKEKTGKVVEVMVYGDGAFNDPQSQIWELADPVVSPGYTVGLKGTPEEVKLKYLADDKFKDLEGQELEVAIANYIQNHDQTSTDQAESIGTTPRQITDLLGSLSDLTSGSGDKGTPFVYIKGYFDNFSDQ